MLQSAEIINAGDLTTTSTLDANQPVTTAIAATIPTKT